MKQHPSNYIAFRKTHFFGLASIITILVAVVVSVGQFTRPQTETKNLADTRIAFAQMTTSFIETFDGKPGAPEAFTQTGQNRWDIQIHSRNSDTWDKLSSMKLHHSATCGPPLTDGATAPYNSGELMTHDTDGTYEDAVFKCSDHVMTGINGIGKSINDSYALAVLTPNHMVDFTDEEATIRFNVTTYRTTQRDWIDVWITPYEDNLNLPFDTGEVDLQGMPINTVQLVMIAPNDNAKTGWKPKILVNGKDTGEFQQYTNDYNWYTSYEDYLPGKAGDPKRRDTFEIKIAKTHISMCMPVDTSDGAPSQTVCWVNKTIKPLPFTKGVVQFAHHSYTPNKDCNLYSSLICGPDTWHWDDIMISPSTAFTMVKADRRMVTSESTAVTFQSPAPLNSKLRFSAIGDVSLSFDGGAYVSVSPQKSTQPDKNHVSNYFTDIPQGTTSVRFKLGDTGAGVHAKDFAIWSQTVDPSLPTSTPTATPVVTIPPSITPTINFTPTPLPTLTNTPTPLPTATPSLTLTPTGGTLPTNTPTPLPTATPAPKPANSTITIYAAGQSALGVYPTMELEINGTIAKVWNNVRGKAKSGVYQTFTYVSENLINPSSVRILFNNDFYLKRFGDRNLRVDKIVIDGVTYQTESASVFSVGAWSSDSGCSAGYKSSEWLNCNGYFQY